MPVLCRQRGAAQWTSADRMAVVRRRGGCVAHEGNETVHHELSDTRRRNDYARFACLIGQNTQRVIAMMGHLS
jgi:hypothetical protein